MEKSEDFLYKFSKGLLMVAGVLCFTHSGYILILLPYLIGMAMFIAGCIILCLSAIEIHSGRKSVEELSNQLTRSVMVMLIGAITIIKGSNALSFIGVSWGLIGLYKSANIFGNMVVRWVKNKKIPWLNVAEATIETVFSSILLFEPVDKLKTHIYLLGIQIIIFALFKVSDFVPDRKK